MCLILSQFLVHLQVLLMLWQEAQLQLSVGQLHIQYQWRLVLQQI